MNLPTPKGYTKQGTYYEALNDFEARHLSAILTSRRFKSNTEAAKEIGIKRTSLIMKVHKLKIEHLLPSNRNEK